MRRVIAFCATLLLALQFALAAPPAGLTWDGKGVTLDQLGEQLGAELADSDGDYAPQYESSAINLWQISVFHGDGRSFALDRGLTRTEAVILTLRLTGAYHKAAAENRPCPFPDVPAWAAPYVGYAVEQKITSGIGGGQFGAVRTVTAAEYLTFVLRALGYQDGVDFTWQKAADKAWEIALIDSVGHTRYTRSNLFLRDDAANITARAVWSVETKSGERISRTIERADPIGSEPPPATEKIWLQKQEEAAWRQITEDN